MIPPMLIRYAPHLAAVAVLAGGLFMSYRWAYGNGVEAERARWEASAAEAGKRFAEQLAAQQATITQLDRDLAAARRRANQRREDLADVIQIDPAARDWAAQPVPDGVRWALGRDRAVPTDP